MSIEEKPVAIFYAGPHGAGKSTFRQAVADDRPFLNIDRDAIAARMPGGPTEDNRLKASLEANKLYKEELAAKRSFSMETTLATPDSLGKMREARAAGYEVELRYMGLASPDLAVERVADRVAQGGQGFDETYVRNTYVGSLKNLPEAVRLADRASVIDNSQLYKPQNFLAFEVNLSQKLHQEQAPAWIKDAAVRIDARKQEMASSNSYQAGKAQFTAANAAIPLPTAPRLAPGLADGMSAGKGKGRGR
jgi:predicted ABC-type ATPase